MTRALDRAGYPWVVVHRIGVLNWLMEALIAIGRGGMIRIRSRRRADPPSPFR